MHIKLIIICSLLVSCISGMNDEQIPASNLHAFDTLPLLNELPPITSYDPQSLAVLPPSWKGMLSKTPHDILQPFPSLIGSYYRKNCPYSFVHHLENLQTFLLGDKIQKATVVSVAEDVSDALKLSPQTRYHLLQAFLHLVHGTAFNTRALCLNYSKDRETSNRLALVNQMPTLLKEIIYRIEDKHIIDAIITPLFKPAFNTLDKDALLKEGLNTIGTRIRNHNLKPKWYMKLISPQTAVHLAEQYQNFVQNDTPFTECTYDMEKERINFHELIASFPPEVKVKIDDWHDEDVWYLTYLAYWLKTENWITILTGHDSFKQSDFIYFLKRIYEKNNGKEMTPEQLNNITTNFLTQIGSKHHASTSGL